MLHESGESGLHNWRMTVLQMRSKQTSKETTRIASSYEIDQQLQAELENGYSWEEPMVIQNPIVSPLTAVIIFDTKEERGAFYGQGKRKPQISGRSGKAVIHTESR